jgi:hypothetical protein
MLSTALSTDCDYIGDNLYLGDGHGHLRHRQGHSCSPFLSRGVQGTHHHDAGTML